MMKYLLSIFVLVTFVQPVEASKFLCAKSVFELSVNNRVTRWVWNKAMFPRWEETPADKRPRALGFFTPTQPKTAWRWYHFAALPVTAPGYAFEKLTQSPVRWLSHRLLGQSYDFTPGHAVVNAVSQAYQLPFWYVSRAIGGSPRRVGLAFTLPASLVATFYLMDRVIDPQINQELGERMIDRVEANSEKWDHLIDSDYRYQKIKKQLESGAINRREAYARAIQLDFDLVEFYQMIADPSFVELSDEKKYERLLGLSLFDSIVQLHREGVKKESNYFYPKNFSEKLSDEQAEDLINLMVTRLVVYKLVWMHVHQADAEALKEERHQDLIQQLITRTSYYEELKRLHEEKDPGTNHTFISTDEFLFRIQEDVDRQIKMMEDAVLRRTKVFKSGTKIDIEDYRSLALREINEKIEKRKEKQKP